MLSPRRVARTSAGRAATTRGRGRARLGLLLVAALLGCRAAGPRRAAPILEPGPVGGVAPAPAALWEPGCRGAEPRALAECVRAERYRGQLARVVGERPPGSAHWQEVQNLCDETLSGLGFVVERHRYGTGVNVIGVREGELPERVMIGAHYDHIPGCPGADDNATGVAGALELARVLSGATFPRTLVVACWDEEERGLIGSRAYAARARARREPIVVYFNFDAIGVADSRPHTQRIPGGFGLLFPEQVAALQARESRADFITLVSDVGAEPWARLMAAAAQRDGLPTAVLAIPRLVQASHVVIDLQRSDHASLWDQGYPAVMITDTAEFRSDAYHCRGRPDTLDTLDAGFAPRVLRATAFAAASALHGPPAPLEPDGAEPASPTKESE